MAHNPDPLLFTPGPLTTSPTVKQAMLHDLGSRDGAFIEVIADIRRRLLSLANADPALYTAVLMQGSGTFGLEAVCASVIPPSGKLLVAVNGAYGRRLARIAGTLRIPTAILDYAENVPVQPLDIREMLRQDPAITHVSLCHCETTSGILNPLSEAAAVVRDAGRSLIVDAMSSFGAIPVLAQSWGIDYLVSSSNKCIQGVPGCALVIANRNRLSAAAGWARSVALDLLDQDLGFGRDGQFRFTPPTHVLLALRQALIELEAEGGPVARGARYTDNRDRLIAALHAMGFVPYLPAMLQSPIIVTVRYPSHPNWDFQRFHQLLNDAGFVIYPGKVGRAASFRIGVIGHLFPRDIDRLIQAIKQALQTLQLPSPLPKPACD